MAVIGESGSETDRCQHIEVLLSSSEMCEVFVDRQWPSESMPGFFKAKPLKATVCLSALQKRRGMINCIWTSLSKERLELSSPIVWTDGDWEPFQTVSSHTLKHTQFYFAFLCC